MNTHEQKMAKYITKTIKLSKVYRARAELYFQALYIFCIFNLYISLYLFSHIIFSILL
jgi:hypothetical protein